MRGPLPMLTSSGSGAAPSLCLLAPPPAHLPSSPQFAMWVDAVIFVFSLEDADQFPDRLPLLQPHGQLPNTSEIPLESWWGPRVSGISGQVGLTGLWPLSRASGFLACIFRDGASLQKAQRRNNFLLKS